MLLLIMAANYTPVRRLQKLIFCPQCRLCGKALCNSKSFCFSCGKSLFRLRKQAPKHALFPYTEVAPAAISLLRASVHQEAAEIFLRVARGGQWLESLRGLDLIVLAPQNRKNPVSGLESFARLLAQELGAELAQGLLKKDPSRRQHGLSFHQRMDCPCFVSCVSAPRALGRRVLLLDDVWTTGTTLEMSAYALRKVGALHVEQRALARQMVPSFDGKREETKQEGDEVPVFLTHLFV